MQAPWQSCPPDRSFDCAPRKEGLIVRVFENEGRKDVTVQLKLIVPVNRTSSTNMIELMIELSM